MYTLLLYSFHSDHSKMVVEEGEILNITIARSYGNNAEVDVTWSCNGNRTNNDVTPSTGMVTFREVRFVSFNKFCSNG